MRVASVLALGASAIVLGSCGGGDSSGPPTGGPTPTPTLSVTLSKSSETIVLQEGETASFGFDASYTGTSPQPIVADVAIGGERYALKGSPTANGTSFSVELETLPYPAGGERTSTVTFRLCTSANCSTVYPGSTQTFEVTLDVQLDDWLMFQRNAAHTGHVAARYDPADFVKIWEHEVKEGLDARPVAATEDTIFVVEGIDDVVVTGPQADRIVALDGSNGQPRWVTELKEHYSISGPSYYDGTLWVTANDTSGTENPLYLFDAMSGSEIAKARYTAQGGIWMQPTIFDGKAYMAAGFGGNEVFGYDAAVGTKLWQSFGSRGVIDGQSVAADSDSIYYYAATGIDLFDRTTGVLKRTITNQFFGDYGADWRSALMLDGQGGIYGMNNFRNWPYTPNSIVGYSINASQADWETAREYFAHPALSNDLIYALRKDVRSLDAISTSDGTVAWSLDIPGSGSLRHNVVSTVNLLFVSTETDVYAFDISQSTRPMVWSAPTGGSLAITSDNLLIVGGLDAVHAYRLF